MDNQVTGRMHDLDVHAVNESVAGLGNPTTMNMGADGEGKTAPVDLPLQHGAALATQSVAQSMAIAVVDATDMLRNVETIMSTAMGVAMAKWVEKPHMAVYGDIIRAARGTIDGTIHSWKSVGKGAGEVLESMRLSGGSLASGSDDAPVE